MGLQSGGRGELAPEGFEQRGLPAEQEMTVAAEGCGGRLQHLARGPAHFEQTGKVDRQLRRGVIGNLKADKLSQSGLVAWINRHGSREQPASLVASIESGKTPGDGEEIFRTEIFLRQQVIKLQVGFIPPAQPMQRDRAKPCDDREVGRA